MTKAGDVIIMRRDAHYAVGVVLDDGNRQPHDPRMHGFADARAWAETWTAETGGRIWIVSDDGQWGLLWTGIRPAEITPLNTATRLAYRCCMCGAEGYVPASPPVNVNDAGEPLAVQALAGYTCAACNRPLA